MSILNKSQESLAVILGAQKALEKELQRLEKKEVYLKPGEHLFQKKEVIVQLGDFKVFQGEATEKVQGGGLPWHKLIATILIELPAEQREMMKAKMIDMLDRAMSAQASGTILPGEEELLNVMDEWKNAAHCRLPKTPVKGQRRVSLFNPQIFLDRHNR